MLASELITLLTHTMETVGNFPVYVSVEDGAIKTDPLVEVGVEHDTIYLRNWSDPEPEAEPSETTEMPTEIAQKSEIGTQETAVEDHDSGDEQPTQPTA